MNNEASEWSALIEEYANESRAARWTSNPRDTDAGRAILASSPKARAWFAMEAERLRWQTGPDGTHRHASIGALDVLADALVRVRLDCTPEQMRKIIWQTTEPKLYAALLRNVERHAREFGLTAGIREMLQLKRAELARRSSTKRDRANLEKMDALLEQFPETN